MQLRTTIPFTLSAIHVHHGISLHADDWLAFCQQCCNQLDVAFTGQHAHLDHHAASGLEAEARAARYQLYAQQPADFIALAHHRDDQAETVMLQLLRGAGAKGLAAMAKYRAQPDQPTYLRPLLDVDRSDIVAWAQAHQLSWVEDDSNSNTHYARNFLRHDFLPILNQRYPAWRATIARSAANLAEAAELLDELAVMDAQSAVQGNRLNCQQLARLSPARGKNLLRHFFSLHHIRMPSQARLDEMLAQLTHTQHDNHLAIQHDAHTLYRYQDDAYLVKN
ncbi:MAG: tRNA lysidine(34) synthetase TilS, partial [Sulfuriferula sp.]